MINLDKFINKWIMHDNVEIPLDMAVARPLPTGTVFTLVSVAPSGGILIDYVAEINKETRNFKFRVVKNQASFSLPHNFRFIGLVHGYEDNDVITYNVYVEKEL